MNEIMIRLILIFTFLFSSNCLANKLEKEKVDAGDFLSILDMRVEKYRLKLPLLSAGKGYILEVNVEEYDGASNKRKVVYSTYLGLGSGDGSLLIKYPNSIVKDDLFIVVSEVNKVSKSLELKESLSGAVSWHFAKELDVELKTEFVLALKVQGYDGLSKVSENINQKLNDFIVLDVPKIFVFKGVITSS